MIVRKNVQTRYMHKYIYIYMSKIHNHCQHHPQQDAKRYEIVARAVRRKRRPLPLPITSYFSLHFKQYHFHLQFE